MCLESCLLLLTPVLLFSHTSLVVSILCKKKKAFIQWFTYGVSQKVVSRFFVLLSPQFRVGSSSSTTCMLRSPRCFLLTKNTDKKKSKYVYIQITQNELGICSNSKIWRKEVCSKKKKGSEVSYGDFILKSRGNKKIKML